MGRSLALPLVWRSRALALVWRSRRPRALALVWRSPARACEWSRAGSPSTPFDTAASFAASCSKSGHQRSCTPDARVPPCARRRVNLHRHQHHPHTIATTGRGGGGRRAVRPRARRRASDLLRRTSERYPRAETERRDKRRSATRRRGRPWRLRAASPPRRPRARGKRVADTPIQTRRRKRLLTF